MQTCFQNLSPSTPPPNPPPFPTGYFITEYLFISVHITLLLCWGLNLSCSKNYDNSFPREYKRTKCWDANSLFSTVYNYYHSSSSYFYLHLPRSLNVFRFCLSLFVCLSAFSLPSSSWLGGWWVFFNWQDFICLFLRCVDLCLVGCSWCVSVCVCVCNSLRQLHLLNSAVPTLVSLWRVELHFTNNEKLVSCASVHFRLYPLQWGTCSPVDMKSLH